MTLEQIKKLPSYEALKRNGFNDSNIMHYYGLSTSERTAYFNQIKNGIAPRNTHEATTKFESQGTQKCTEGLYNRVNAEFKRLMKETYEFRGIEYNLNEYSIGWNNNKSRFGVHKMKVRRNFLNDKEFYGKRIELSKFMLDNADKTFEDWVDTILHEIAHALDYKVRGTSNHDRHWQMVARHIGCSGERCGSHKVDAKSSKYTLTCKNCKKEVASHKKKRRVSACGSCCKKYNGGVYSLDYALIQTQNY